MKAHNSLYRRTKLAFTLLELMVVIALIALVAAMLLPALAGTRANSAVFQCRNNLKQLANAWAMYASDNSELLVNFNTYAGTSPTSMAGAANGVPWRTQISGGFVSVSLPPDITPNTPAAQIYLTEMSYKQPRNTEAQVINGPLYPYAPSVKLIHCPGDFRAGLKFQPNYNGPFSWDSYSGVGTLNGEAMPALTKRTQIFHPSNLMAWAEGGDVRGENLGSWIISNTGTPKLGFSDAVFYDSPAAYHNGGADFNFCDGHVELHQWQDPTTVVWANETWFGKDNYDSAAQSAYHAGNVDAIWVGSHYPTSANP